MTKIDPRHPRYRSLLVRERLGQALRAGVVVPEGLIAHGRAEAFDYYLGERTTPSAAHAEKAAALWLSRALWPTVSVNGNVAALASEEVAALVRALPNLRVEVNLFHRTPARVRAVGRALRRAGVREVLGLHPTVRIPGLSSDRALVDEEGIFAADICLIPLEDGDRAEALRAMGKKVIAIDLNPFSRTALAADIPIVDELTRALRRIREELPRPSRSSDPRRLPPFNARAALRAAQRAMARRLRARGAGPASRQRLRGSARRRRRTP